MNAAIELEAFHKIVFFPAPINIQINTDLLLQYFDNKKTDIKTPGARESLWKGIQPIRSAAIANNGEKQDKEFLSLFPDLLPQIREFLPIKNFVMFHIWEQATYVSAHQDSKSVNDYHFPCAYRILLIKPVEQTFFVHPFKGPNYIFDKTPANASKGTPTEKVFVKMPQESNVFCFNNSACAHGSSMPTQRKLIAFLEGELDLKRHHQLIQFSLEKYPEYVIYKD